MTLPRDFTLLQVIPELDTGGAEQSTLDVARAVVRAGGRALVATRGGRMSARLEGDGGRMTQMPVQSKNPLVIFGNASRLVDVIRKERVDIVHARSRAPAFSALWAAKATKIPFVATYHGVYHAKSSLKRWYNAVMTRGDLVIANSDYTRAHVLAEHDVDPAKVVSIPRGIDLERFNPSYVTPDRIAALRAAWGIEGPRRRVSFLLAARLTRIKGHATIIDAAAGLKDEGRDFRIVFAGDDQGRTGYREELERAIAEAGLEDHVILPGHCDDMPAAYLACDVALLPSIVPESFGRTAVEPQVMARPVIASDLGGMTETVLDGRTGWLVPPGDAAAWRNALARAIDSGAQGLTAMGQAAAERARRLYSVDAMCAATLDAYSRLLEDRR